MDCSSSNGSQLPLSIFEGYTINQAWAELVRRAALHGIKLPSTWGPNYNENDANHLAEALCEFANQQCARNITYAPDDDNSPNYIHALLCSLIDYAEWADGKLPDPTDDADLEIRWYHAVLRAHTLGVPNLTTADEIREGAYCRRLVEQDCDTIRGFGESAGIVEVQHAAAQIARNFQMLLDDAAKRGL